MPKGPNHRADKGFSREIKKISERQLPTNKPFKGKLDQPVPSFEWSRPLIQPTATSMATPHRLQNQSKVKAAKPEFASQQRAYADSKKGKS